MTRRFAAHNEETNLSYNRYGYDTALWYRRQGIVLAESGPIPMDPDPSASQFCVAVIDPGDDRRRRPHSSRQNDSHMIDLGFAALLALISAGFGKRILDGLGRSPEHPLDAMALACRWAWG